MLICVDPGHGGKDPGAVGPNGLRESDVTLDVSRRLVSLLKTQGHSVVLTHNGDKTWSSPNASLAYRVNVANKARADLFVSIHCNAALSPSAHGIETFCYKRGGQGEKYARAIQGELVKSLGLRDRGVKTATFYVLRKTVMPAVLVELGFISNAQEERLLADPSFRQKCAEAIARAIGGVS